MQVGVVMDELFLGHQPPASAPALGSHPERPERLRAVADALAAAGLATRATRLSTRAAREEELGLVHTAGAIADLARIVPGQTGWLDDDTYYSPGSWAAALAAAGAAVDLTLASVAGRLPRGLAVVRPPGHHATPSRPMGFCLFNNVAIAAAAARAAGCARVAVVDWDVHHGNGTQDAFYDDPSVLYVSTHQYPFYPGSGASTEIGTGAGVGTTVNVPLPAGSGDAEYAAAFDDVVAPALLAFRPDLILVSAGYDPFAEDPLAEMTVSTDGFRRMAEVVRRTADAICAGRMVCVLEGGYDLAGLAAGTLATFNVLAAAAAPPPFTSEQPVLPSARLAIEATQRALAPHFPKVWPQFLPKTVAVEGKTKT